MEMQCRLILTAKVLEETLILISRMVRKQMQFIELARQKRIAEWSPSLDGPWIKHRRFACAEVHETDVALVDPSE
jgi:hypothetical protein